MDKRRTITFKINPESNMADNVVSTTLDSVPQGERGRLSRAALAAGLALYRQDARLHFLLCELLTHNRSYSEIEQILQSIKLGGTNASNNTSASQKNAVTETETYPEEKTKSNGRKLIS